MTDLIDVPTTTLARTGLLIGGEIVHTDDTLAVHDPAAPERVVGYAASAGPDQARRAIDAADAAFPGWAATPASKRAEILRSAVAKLEDSSQRRAALLVRENGKIAGEAGADLAVFAGRCLAAADLAAELGRIETFDAPPRRSEVHALPVGVVTIIVPFNWPAAILGASLPYALVAGNTVVVKPPPSAPLALVQTLEIIAATLPPGVLNVVTGSNEGVEPLLTDRRVQKIVFTGSTEAGRKIMTAAATSLTSVTLELGGNDPAILLDDVVLDADTIHRLVIGAFLTTGQVCMATKRLYVHRSRYTEVVDQLSAALDAAVVGPGSDPTSTMGPLHSASGRNKVVQLLDEARSAGAEVRELGMFGPGVDGSGGHFLRPALVLDPDPSLGIVTQEQFGPALPILPFDDAEALVAQLNCEWSGLCSSVWSADVDRAHDLAATLRTGTTWINVANAVACDDRVPFGGFRASGIGREMGLAGLRSFTEPHAITR